MNSKDLKRAKKEAKRFIKAANEALEKSFYYRPPTEHHNGFETEQNHQHLAAAKRASMDLTRALVKVRK